MYAMSLVMTISDITAYLQILHSRPTQLRGGVTPRNSFGYGTVNETVKKSLFMLIFEMNEHMLENYMLHSNLVKTDTLDKTYSNTAM